MSLKSITHLPQAWADEFGKEGAACRREAAEYACDHWIDLSGLRVLNSALLATEAALTHSGAEDACISIEFDKIETITPEAAAALVEAFGSESLSLPALTGLTPDVARRLAQHKGELHLDGLSEGSDDALRELLAHPNLWIPDDINQRLDNICDSFSDEDADSQTRSQEARTSGGERSAQLHQSGIAGEHAEHVTPNEDVRDVDAYEDGEEQERDIAEVREEAVMDDLAPEPRRPSVVMDALLRPLAQLVGLEEVKSTIKSVIAMAHIGQRRRREGLSVAPVSYHMAFFGPPGTGKTTVARLVAEILREAGVLSRGHLVETDGQGLVAKYLGQTGHRVREIVERSLGGVLFIDEAYSLSPRDGSAGAYASEAIATLVPLLETHREDLVVIVAGYEEEMNELFASNPGLRSRFPHHMVFPAMDIEQLQAVYEHLAAEYGYLMSTRFKSAVRYALERERRIRGRRFSNARAVRTLFEATLARQAERLANFPGPSVIELQTLLLEDLPDQVA
jgi:stage V sporulation protein K